MPLSHTTVKAERDHRYYVANQEHIKQRNREWYRKTKSIRLKQSAQRRSINRAYLHNAKSAPCMDCGNRFPSECMDFDHRDSNEKSLNVGQMIGYSIENIQTEIDKCDLVCANCHRIRTHNRRMNR